ncbi:MAG: hypothetical protein WAT79_06655 [Saprospiraceae bacterium]
MSQDIHHLLEKYWEGETTLEEEKTLQAYYRTGNVAEEHKAFSPLFEYIAQQETLSYSLPPLENVIQQARETKVIRLKTYTKWIYAIAAVFVLGLASWFVFLPNVSETNQASLIHEIEDPEEAYRVTMEALAMVSGKLNRGTESISIGLGNVDKANIFKE